MFVRIVNRVPHAIDLRLFGDGPDGADGRALAALHTRHGAEVAIEGRPDGRIEATSLSPERTDVLGFRADTHTATAFDALAVVTNQSGCGQVDSFAGPLTGIGDRANPEFCGKLLQFAVFPPITGLAISVVFGQEQFDHQLPSLPDSSRIGADFHAFRNRHGARSCQIHLAFDLHDTDAARADRL